MSTCMEGRIAHGKAQFRTMQKSGIDHDHAITSILSTHRHCVPLEMQLEAQG